MDTKGGKLRWGGDGGVLNWAIAIDMYTLMCIKLMPIKNLQYKKTNKQTNKKKVICPPKTKDTMVNKNRMVTTNSSIQKGK